MYRLFFKKILLVLLGSLFISSCAGKSKKDDFDLSEFIKPVQQRAENNKKTNQTNLEKKEVELKNLIPLKDREEVTNSIKYGKKDPFSASNNELNKFTNDFKLKGFISFENNDYALVEYKKQKGIIDLNSVGGINTKMLPTNVFVKDINPSQEKINLSIEGEIYTINLNL